MNNTTDEQKLERIRNAWNDIHNFIATSTHFLWTVIAEDHKLTWSSGSQSIGAIMRDKLRWVESDPKKVGVLRFTERFISQHEYNNDEEKEKIAKILLRQIDGWVPTKRSKKNDEIPKGLIPYDPIAKTIDLSEIEVYALKEILSTLNSQRLHKPGIMMIAGDVLEKLMQ